MGYTIYTGAGGYDIFMEAFEKEAGFVRVFIGNKILRILRKCKNPIRRTMSSKKYYKLVRK